MKQISSNFFGLSFALLLCMGCSIQSSEEGNEGGSLYPESSLSVSRRSGIPANGDASVGIEFRLLNPNAEPIAGMEIAIRASGTHNEIFQENTLTDEDGIITATLRSREAESKTISVVRLRGGEEIEILEPTAIVYFGDLFGEAVRFGIGDSPRGLVGGDFDGDGIVDIATVNVSPPSVAILNGDALLGSDSIGSVTRQDVGNSPRDLATGDVDGDGDLDIVTANQSENSVTTLRNRGSGTFIREDFPTGEGPQKVLLVDLNQDDALDILTLNTGNDVSDRISVLINTSAFNFSEPTFFPAGEAPTALSAGDLDNDGNTDLVVSNSSDDNILVLHGSGDGIFTTGGTYATGPSPQSLALGDLNEDGFLDAITGNDDNDVPISILVGNGDGSFGEALAPPFGNSRVREVLLKDFNGDGTLDLSFSHGNEVSIALGDGWGTFDDPMEFSTEGSTSGKILSLDATGDEVLDLIVLNRGSSNISFFTVSDSFNLDFEGQCESTPHLFSENVLPIFSNEGCTGCHEGSSPSGGLNLATGDIHAALLGGRVDLEQPANSEILTKPTGQVNHDGGTLFSRSSQQYLTIFCWIESGGLDD